MRKLLVYIFLSVFCMQTFAIAETRVDGGKVDTYKTIKMTGRIYNDAFKSFTDADATPSVSGGNLFLTANTGATNVTNFTNGVTGEQVVIAFGDSLTTLKHGATINLQGASDYTGTSGDTIALVKRGLVWYEIGRAGSIAPTTSKVKVSSLDTTANYISNKILSGNDITFAIGSPGGAETFTANNTSTLATVTARGATTATASSFTGGLIAGTTFQLPNANNPTTTVTGELAYDTNNNSLETWNGISSVLIPTLYDKDFVVYGPDSINTTVGLFHVDSDIYPFGITLVNVQFDIATAEAYTLVFEEWTGMNTKYKVNNIVSLSTVTAEDYAEARNASITDQNIAADNWVMINIPATTATWIHGKVIYQVKEGN